MPCRTPELQREFQRKWIAKRRTDWVAANGPCVQCGSSERLEVDHKNHADKLINPRALWSMSAKNPRRIAELAKCQVLCHDCHKAKSRPLSSAISRELIKGMKRGPGGRFLPVTQKRLPRIAVSQEPVPQYAMEGSL